MKAIKRLFVIGLALVAMNAFAESRLFIEPFTINPGETKQIELKGITDVRFGGFQCRIKAPAGLTWGKIKGKYNQSFDDDENEIYPVFMINESKVLTVDDPETAGVDDTGALSLMWAKFTGGNPDADPSDPDGNYAKYYEPGKVYTFMILKVTAAADYDNSQDLLMYNMRYSDWAGEKTTVVPDLLVNTEVIETIAGEKAVKEVKYVNLLGVESNEPFQGVNVVVTTYEDGTKSAQKIVK